MGTKGRVALWLCGMALACSSCGHEEMSPQAQDAGVYTRYNLHYIVEKGMVRGSFANWTDWPGHAFLPYNTKVRTDLWINRIRFETDTGLEIMFELNAGRMGMSSSQYIDLITSPTPVTYENLSDVDRQGIQAGKALVGMSKEGVQIALGYPARHRTPSLEDNRWTYWKGRHDTYVVEFDSSGKVARITN